MVVGLDCRFYGLRSEVVVCGVVLALMVQYSPDGLFWCYFCCLLGWISLVGC